MSETSRISSWSRSGKSFTAAVHVHLDISEWAAHQTPQSRHHHPWGVLLGRSASSETAPETHVAQICPVRNRAHLQFVLGEWLTRGEEDGLQPVGLCGWGSTKRGDRDLLELFDEFFPESGSVLLVLKPTGALVEPELFIREGSRPTGPERPPAQSLADRPVSGLRAKLSGVSVVTTLTWALAILLVLVGVPLLLWPSLPFASHPAVAAPRVATPLELPAPSLEASEPASDSSTRPVPSPEVKDVKVPAASKRPSPQASLKARRNARQADIENATPVLVTSPATRSPKWTRPFRWLRDSAWKPVSGYVHRR